MTGLERLRELGREQEERSWSTVGKVRGRLMLQIAEQIEDERFREQLAVERVASEMELHCLGVEGMDDSPVVRWARELREALGRHCRDGGGDAVAGSPCDGLSDEEVEEVAIVRADAMEAWRWVREHGGLSHVKDIYHDLRAVVERLGVEWSEGELHGLMGVLDRRLMPEGVEWPRFEDGEMVRIGDKFECWCGETNVVESVTIMEGRSVLNKSQSHAFVVSDGPFTAHGKRLQRLAVLAADGEPLEAGQTVWHRGGNAHGVVESIDAGSLMRTVRYRGEDGTEYRDAAKDLTHQRPVLDADGVPIHEGDTVWCMATNDELTDMNIVRKNWPTMRAKLTVKSIISDSHGDKWADFEETYLYVKTCYLTHTNPGPRRTCQDCRFWQKDPTARTMGVCWRNYAERDCEDSYEARIEDAPACEYFRERGE